MLLISDHIKKLPKKDLKKWIADREKEKRSDDWAKELEKLKDGIGKTRKESKDD